MAKETNYAKKAAACVRIAEICARSDDYPAALGWYERACELYEKHYGGCHPYVAIAYCQIGRIYLRMDANSLACNAFEHAYIIRKKTFGATDKKTLDALFLLAGACANVGDYERAESLLTKLLYVRKQTLDAGHEDIIDTCNSLASVCIAQEKYDIALSRLNHAMDLCKDKGVPFANTALNLAKVYILTDEPRLALEWYLSAYEAYDGADYVGHCAKASHGAANAYIRLGSYDEALTWGERALTLSRSYYGEASLNTSAAYNDLGMIYHRRGNPDKTIANYERALEINLSLLGEKHMLIARSYINLASAYESMGDREHVMNLYERAMEIMEGLPVDKAQTASFFNNIAVAYHRAGNYKRALDLYSRAAELCEDNPAGIATALGNIGGVLLAQKDFEEAARYLNKSYDMLSAALGESHPDTASCGYNIGLLHAYKGEYALAIEWYERAYSHTVKAFGCENEQALRIATMMAKAKELLEKE